MIKKMWLSIFSVVAVILSGSIVINSADIFESATQPPDNIVSLSKFNLIGPLPILPEQMMVYETLDRQVTEDFMEYYKDLFDMDGEIQDLDQYFVVTEGDRVLEVSKETGTGYFHYCDNAKVLLEENVELPSKIEAQLMAEDFLESEVFLDLPESRYLASIDYNKFTMYDNDGNVISEGSSSLDLEYHYKIDGIKIIGSGAKLGVVYGEDNEMVEVYKYWRDLDLNTSKKMTIIRPEDAIDNFKLRWPREGTPEELEDADIVTEVNIKKVEIVYYAYSARYSQMTLEPYYIIEGNYSSTGEINNKLVDVSDWFSVLIPAIPSYNLEIVSIDNGKNIKGISASIKNIGTIAAEVEWSISVVGGWIFNGGNTNDNIYIPPGETVKIGTQGLSGFGIAMITITVGEVTYKSSYFILGGSVFSIIK